jgi:hypothetical protein
MRCEQSVLKRANRLNAEICCFIQTDPPPATESASNKRGNQSALLAIAPNRGTSMPSYQATVSKPGADGEAEFFASHEFEAPDTLGAMAAADVWFRSETVISPGPASIRLYAGKVLICKRASPGGKWEK